MGRTNDVNDGWTGAIQGWARREALRLRRAEARVKSRGHELGSGLSAASSHATRHGCIANRTRHGLFPQPQLPLQRGLQPLHKGWITFRDRADPAEGDGSLSVDEHGRG